MKGSLIPAGIRATAARRAEDAKEKLWMSFFEQPSEWYDFRPLKWSWRHPDFSHSITKERLWIDGSPKWVRAKLESQASDLNTKKVEVSLECIRPKTGDQFPAKPSDEEKEKLWIDFFENPSHWRDTRFFKRLSWRFPDFIKAGSLEGLWIGGSPEWVKNKLKAMDLQS